MSPAVLKGISMPLLTYFRAALSPVKPVMGQYTLEYVLTVCERRNVSEMLRKSAIYRLR